MAQDDMSSQVTLPEPVAGHSNNGYRVRIAEVGTDKFRCSEDFYLVSSADALDFGEPGGPTMTVVAPQADALAVAGEMYTVEVSHCCCSLQGFAASKRHWSFFPCQLLCDKDLQQVLIFFRVVCSTAKR